MMVGPTYQPTKNKNKERKNILMARLGLKYFSQT
jgi:hypothetical protein